MMRCQSNSELLAVWLFKSLRSTFWHKATVQTANQSTAANTVKQLVLTRATKCEIKAAKIRHNCRYSSNAPRWGLQQLH